MNIASRKRSSIERKFGGNGKSVASGQALFSFEGFPANIAHEVLKDLNFN
jgi:hypothetical protein